MDAQRWQQIEILYHATLERASDERFRFLSDQCAGDETLFVEVDSLLSAHNDSEDFLTKSDFSLGLRLLNTPQTI